MSEHDYVLGTHDEEIARLGLQHRVWRSRTLECWARAGLQEGMHVLDIGAGPGFATIDLAEIVGLSGSVTAFERSDRFIDIGRKRCEGACIRNVEYTQGDLMLDPLVISDIDMAWVRWVFCFLSNPELAMKKIVSALKPGGRIAIHEYVDYGTWRAIPEAPAIEKFVSAAMTQWRVNGGEPDIARKLPEMITRLGLKIESIEPIVFAMKPTDYAWNWPRLFIANQADRLSGDKSLTVEEADSAKREFAELTENPDAIMLSPMVLEIVAQRV